MASKALKDMSEDLLNCSICMSSYKTPKMLPCIHSFCDECLEKYAAKLGTDQIPCPTCRKVCKLPETGVKGLQSNFLLVNLAERVALLEKLTSTQKSAAVCDSCKSPKIVAFCVNCNQTVCAKCQSQHALFPSLHVVISLTQVNDPKFQHKWMQLKSPSCQLHPSEKLNFFCNTCSRLICRDCTIVQHSKPEHECVEASSKFADVKNALCRLLEAGKEEMDECSALLRGGAEGYDLMKEELKRVEEEIDAVCKKNVLEIEGKYKDLKTQMVAEIAESFVPVEDQIDHTKNWLKRMQNTQEITQKLIDENNPWELLAMSTDLAAAFQELKTDSASIELGPSALKNKVSFRPSPVPEIQLGAWKLFPADAVATDGTGNFFLCNLTRSNKMLSIVKISVKDSQIEHVCSHEWTDEIPKGSNLRAEECSGRYLLVGIGSVIAQFDHLSKSFGGKIGFSGPGSIQCMAYDERRGYMVAAGSDSSIHLYRSNLTYGGAHTIHATPPVLSLCSNNFEYIYHTKRDGIKHYSAASGSHNSLQVPLPTTQNMNVTDILQSSSDGNRTIFILHTISESDGTEQVKGGTKSGEWLLQEYRFDQAKVLGVLDCQDVGMNRPPSSLICAHAGDGVTLHLCDDCGKITTCKRGVYTTGTLKYQKA